MDQKTFIEIISMREKIVAGNWKMNLSPIEAHNLISKLSDFEVEGVKQIIFPTFLYLDKAITSYQRGSVGAQNFYPKNSGAFTGEVSISQLKELGVTYVLIGHSERRSIFQESNQFVKEKVDAAIQAGINIIFCCGESLEVRESGEQVSFVLNQLKESLFHLTAEELKNVTIAYEPIWAIGTGKTASSNQAEEMHASIRKAIEDQYDGIVAETISILYGGSCNAQNAKELFACPNVDGGLIGGASLLAEDFYTITNSFE